MKNHYTCPLGDNPDRLYTVATALTDYFQGTIGEAKLRQEIRKGKIPHVRIGTKIILRKAALDAWAAEQERQSVAKAKPLRMVR